MAQYNLMIKLYRFEFKLEVKFEFRIERNKKKENNTVHFGPTDFPFRPRQHSLLRGP